MFVGLNLSCFVHFKSGALVQRACSKIAGRLKMAGPASPCGSRACSTQTAHWTETLYTLIIGIQTHYLMDKGKKTKTTVNRGTLLPYGVSIFCIFKPSACHQGYRDINQTKVANAKEQRSVFPTCVIMFLCSPTPQSQATLNTEACHYIGRGTTSHKKYKKNA